MLAQAMGGVEAVQPDQMGLQLGLLWRALGLVPPEAAAATQSETQTSAPAGALLQNLVALFGANVEAPPPMALEEGSDSADGEASIQQGASVLGTQGAPTTLPFALVLNGGLASGGSWEPDHGLARSEPALPSTWTEGLAGKPAGGFAGIVAPPPVSTVNTAAAPAAAAAPSIVAREVPQTSTRAPAPQALATEPPPPTPSSATAGPAAQASDPAFGASAEPEAIATWAAKPAPRVEPEPVRPAGTSAGAARPTEQSNAPGDFRVPAQQSEDGDGKASLEKASLGTFEASVSAEPEGRAAAKAPANPSAIDRADTAARQFGGMTGAAELSAAPTDSSSGEVVTAPQAVVHVATAQPNDRPAPLPEAAESRLRPDLPDQVVRAARITIDRGGGTARVQLEPPELGRLDLEIKVANGGTVSMHIVSHSQETRLIVQSHLADLQSALQEGGFEVGELSVSVRDQQGDFGAPKDESPWGRAEPGPSPDVISEYLDEEVSPYGRTYHRGLIDYRA